ncbi:MAG: hypothetical protein ABI882_05075 [Acidobacteriota bacterium]
MLVVLITLLAVANGYRLVSFVKASFSFWERTCAGAVVGLALLAWIGFLAALLAGLNVWTIGATIFIEIVIWVALERLQRTREMLAEVRAAIAAFDPRSGVYYLIWTALLFWLFARVVMFQDGAFLTAPANNYGDLPFHLSAITSFAWGDNYPPSNPIFAGSRFTYPFLIDFLTAFFLRAGAGWRMAFLVENIVLSVSLVGIVETLAFRFTGNRLAARLTPLIFLFNGGFGFLNFFNDLAGPEGFFSTIAHLPHTYTMNAMLPTRFGEVPLRWGNAFTTLIIPQRSLLFGLPIVGLVLTCWWTALQKGTALRERRRLLIAAGILTGILPLLHAHSFFAIGIATLILVPLFWSRDWVAYFVPVLVLALPQALYLMGTPVRDDLFKKHLGWESDKVSPVLFWLANAGPFIFLLIAALGTRGMVETRTRRFYWPFLIWFILPNLVLLAPWPWDNIKVLICWSLVSAPFIALVLADGFRRSILWRLASGLLLIILTLSGVLDVIRALSPVEKVTLFGAAEVEVAEMLRSRTEPGAIIAHAPIHNSSLCLAGRQSLMGYPGHLWTHGIDYSERERDLQRIFRGGVGASELITRYGIDYLLIGPIERRQFSPDEKAIGEKYPLVFEHSEYRVYDTRK